MPNSKKERAKSKKNKNAAALSKKRSSVSPSVAAAASRIDTANAIPELSKGLEAFLSIDLPAANDKTSSPEDAPVAEAAAPKPEPVRLGIRSWETLDEGDAQSMYDLLKENMYDMYQDAGWGWNEAEKWREMKHRNARFLIAGCGSSNDVDERGSGKGKGAKADSGGDDGSSSEEKTSERRREGEGERGRLAGYCHFRFAWDEDENDDGEGEGGTEDVLYVYELQVASWAKRRGLGRRMMQALELLANKHGMSKVMLTVFKENRQAMSFYTKKMKYGVDNASPSKWDDPDEVYEILSKPTRQGTARAREAIRLTATLLD